MTYDHRVGDSHRTNELSLIPGGSVIKLVYAGNKHRVYDKIKNVEAYSKHAQKDNSVLEIWVDGVLSWKR
jgi:hypothetical protein